jgi:hypothetical protein
VQWIRLQKESQPWEQLNEVIEEIIRLTLSSKIETASNEKLRRREPAREATATAAKRWSRWTAPKNFLGSRWISIAMLGSS